MRSSHIRTGTQMGAHKYIQWQMSGFTNAEFELHRRHDERAGAKAPSIHLVVNCSSYVSHHVGTWTHRPARLLIAPYRICGDKEKPEDNEDVIYTFHIHFIRILSYYTSHRPSPVSVGHPTCNDVSINHYSNQHPLFDYLLWQLIPVHVCYPLLVIHRGLTHNWRWGTRPWSSEIQILPQTGDGNLQRGSSRRFNVYHHGTNYVEIRVHLQAEIHLESLETK